MDELVKSLFEDIQYVVLGGLGVGLAAYFLATYHPWGRWLIRYVTALAGFWRSSGVMVDNFTAIGIRVALIVGALYYLGVAAIVFSYWFVEPVRFAVLDCVYEAPTPRPFAAACGDHDPTGDQAGEVSFGEILVLPIVGHFYRTQSNSNRTYLENEAAVDNQVSKRIHSVLSDELTFARLLRATALYAFLAALISIGKLLFVLMRMPNWRVWPRWQSWLDHVDIYINLINEKPSREESANGDAGRAVRLQRGRTGVIYPQTIIFLIALSLYALAMMSYRTIEFEYSSLVRDSASAPSSTNQ